MNSMTRLCALVLALACAHSFAAKFYVAPNGSDQGTGAIDNPFKAFYLAQDAAGAGDTIYARGGEYGLANATVVSSNSSGSVTRYMIGLKSYNGRNGDNGSVAPYPAYTATSGTDGNPTVIMAYPGEKPVFNMADIGKTAIGVSGGFAYWVVDGFEIIGGVVAMWGGSSSGRTHDITVRNCIIRDVEIGGDMTNRGMIKIDRGDPGGGGAYNIFIHNNVIHNMKAEGHTGTYEDSPDRQHTAALTTLSQENYFGWEPQGTEYIEFIGNEVYHVPMVFFFKNPMRGPVKIENNVFHDCPTMGSVGTSDMGFVSNLVYNVDNGFLRLGKDMSSETDERMWELNGMNAVITNNTFVGIGGLVEIVGGTGHRIEKNVVFGLGNSLSGANWNTNGYIKKGTYPFDSTDVTKSLLQSITDCDNCMIAPYDNFVMVKRFWPDGSGGWNIDHYSFDDAKTTFGFGERSVMIVATDEDQVFVDPASHDYHLKAPALCPGMGYYQSPGISLPSKPNSVSRITAVRNARSPMHFYDIMGRRIKSTNVIVWGEGVRQVNVIVFEWDGADVRRGVR